MMREIRGRVTSRKQAFVAINAFGFDENASAFSVQFEAHLASLHANTDGFWAKIGKQVFGDFTAQVFLELGFAGVMIDDADKAAQAGDMIIGDVFDGYGSEKRDKMVSAKAVEGDVAQGDCLRIGSRHQGQRGRRFGYAPHPVGHEFGDECGTFPWINARIPGYAEGFEKIRIRLCGARDIRW